MRGSVRMESGIVERGNVYAGDFKVVCVVFKASSAVMAILNAVLVNRIKIENESR